MLIVLNLGLTAKAQVEGDLSAEGATIDTVGSDETERLKSPKKATLLSAVLPGAGQIYNQKYWKLPIVYGGFATSIYFILDNRRNYREFRSAYLMDLDTNSGSSVYADRGISTDQLRAAADQRRLWMEWSYIATGIIYVLQVVDAAVDAHLYHFNISDDLTLRWRPQVIHNRNQGAYAGVNLSLHF